MVNAGVRQVRDADRDGLAVTVGGLMGVEGQEDGLKAGEGGFTGVDSAGEVEAREGGDEAEDEELEGGVGGVEGVVEPAAEVVVGGAGGGVAEEGGDFGGERRRVEEREGRVVGGEEGRGEGCGVGGEDLG